MSYSNAQLERMAGVLEKHLSRTDLIGYAAARNTRIIGDEILDYEQLKDRLIMRYGEESGDGSYSIKPGSEGFAKFLAEIKEWAEAESDPAFYKIPSKEVIGKLSGTEILEIDWMLED